MKEEPRKILFIQTAFLGDVVFSTALLREITARYPRAEVTVLASPRGGGILDGDPSVARVVIFDKSGAQKGPVALYRLARSMRGEGFDLVVSPHRSLRSAVIARSSGAPARLGFRDRWRRWAYNRGVPWPAGEPMPHRRELRLLEGLGGRGGPVRPRLALGEGQREEVRRLFEGEGFGPDERIVACVPGTVWPTKKWPGEHFLELVRRLRAPGGARVVIVGGPGERDETERLFNGEEGVVNLAGKTGLALLPALLDRCHVVVAGDTGPLHAAMAVGTPVVALFGPTDERQFEFGESDRCLTVDLDCRPCRPHGSLRCPEENWRCMPGIDVGRVEAAVMEALARP